MRIGGIMPLNIIKDVWDYTTYNKPFFLFILVLFFILCVIKMSFEDMDTDAWLLAFVPYVFISGYGMIITKDRINHGKRLPKILIKDVIVLGIKSTVVSGVYIIVQGAILEFISSPLNFPEFDLEDMLMNMPETMNLLYSHNPVHTVVFIVSSLIVFYFTMFFMEMALAKLADTGSIRDAFNLHGIKKIIDVIGWRTYVKDYTQIIVPIGLYSLLLNIDIPILVLSYAYQMVLVMLIFITQYVGIGDVYNIFKEKQSKG
jgi:hypothetical protein